VLPAAVVLLTGGALVYGTIDMPRFGDPEAPIHKHPSPSYVERTPGDIDMPNVVTAVLASYRGYDTLGETVVVFTACIAVLLLLRPVRKDEEAEQ
jgi:multicomponent Na+:H+ antiporter subunit B